MKFIILFALTSISLSSFAMTEREYDRAVARQNRVEQKQRQDTRCANKASRMYAEAELAGHPVRQVVNDVCTNWFVKYVATDGSLCMFDWWIAEYDKGENRYGYIGCSKAH